MNNLRLLLLEDLDEEAAEVIDFLEDNDYEVIRVKNSNDAEKELKNKFFDIILLDIMINGKPEGISLAHRLNRQNINIPFLFLTSMQSKTVFNEAKLTKPYTYLLKPFNKLELLYSLELALEKFYQQSSSISLSSKNAIISPSFLFLKKKNSVVKVEISTIIYVEVVEKYCKIVTENGEFLIKLSLLKVKELLKDSQFYQTHRSFLINTEQIEEIFFDDNLLKLKNNYTIPFSERFKNNFKKYNTIFK